VGFHLYEDTWETSTTTGTGTYTLGGAVPQYRAFSAQYANGDTCLYAAFDGTNFEMGIGTYSASTLARTTIYRSTNSNAAVSWSTGTRQVMVTPLGVSMEQLMTPGSTGYPRRTADNAWTYDATGQIPGIASNAAASTGNIGELIKNSASGVTEVSGVVTNICSISLTAGDWDVDGLVTFGNAGSTLYTLVNAGWNSTSAVMANSQFIQVQYVTGDSMTVATARGDLQLSGTTTVYLIGSCSFSSTASVFSGSIRARRMR